jgi:hypothetical protein
MPKKAGETGFENLLQIRMSPKLEEFHFGKAQTQPSWLKLLAKHMKHIKLLGFAQ